jgi:hypothetical protein
MSLSRSLAARPHSSGRRETVSANVRIGLPTTTRAALENATAVLETGTLSTGTERPAEKARLEPLPR